MWRTNSIIYAWQRQKFFKLLKNLQMLLWISMNIRPGMSFIRNFLKNSEIWKVTPALIHSCSYGFLGIGFLWDSVRMFGWMIRDILRMDLLKNPKNCKGARETMNLIYSDHDHKTLKVLYDLYTMSQISARFGAYSSSYEQNTSTKYSNIFGRYTRSVWEMWKKKIQ